jgi:hypothetical protein
MALPKVGDGYQVSDGNVNEAVNVGVSGGTISFFGETAVAQQTAVTAVATTAATSTTNAFGYTTSTQADAIVTAVNAIITRLKNLGLTA